jgi:GNAT superfamily N-acetyltransferase
MLSTRMLTSCLPPGLTLTRLAPEDGALGQECRRFCLRAIKDAYGHDYRPNWHADLDSLGAGAACQYAASCRGAFFVLRDRDGHVIGTAGVRGLGNNRSLAATLAHRYPDIDRVAFNCRLYVAPAWRRHGLGRLLTALRAEAARGMDYTTVYIHCDANAERLRRYWLDLGFGFIGEGNGVAHYDKVL